MRYTIRFGSWTRLKYLCSYSCVLGGGDGGGLDGTAEKLRDLEAPTYLNSKSRVIPKSAWPLTKKMVVSADSTIMESII